VGELTRVERYLPYVCGALLALPTLVAHYLPMSDLPLHEGVVGVLRHFGDEEYFPKGLYVLNLGHSNQLFHVLAWALSYFVGTTWAVKLVVAAAQVLIFVAGARFADHVGRSRWAVPLLAPLALGFTYYWGLVANLLGFAGFLFALPILDRAAVEPTPRRAAWTCVVLILLFYAHNSIFVAGSAFAATLAVAHPFDRRKTALRAVPVLFAPVFLTAYYFWSLRSFTGGQVRPPMQFTPLLTKLSFVPNVIFGSHDLPAQLMLFGLSLTALAAFVVARVRAKEPHEVAAAGSFVQRASAFVLRHRFEGTALAFLVGFVAMPFQWNGATMVYERFLGPAWAIGVICCAPRGDAPRVGRLASAVLPIGILLLAWPQFLDADRTYRDLDAIIARIPKKSSTALMSVDRPVFKTRVYSASVGPARAVADRGGRLGLSLAISPLSPIQIKQEYRWDEYDLRTILNGSRALIPRHDLKRFEWIIAQSRERAVRDIIVDAFKPDAVAVASEGEWVLFHSTWEQVPLMSPDTRPDPRLETILERVRYHVQLRFEQEQRAQGASTAAPPGGEPTE